jgi:hypothetical protein
MKHRKRRALPGLVILLVGLIAHCIGGGVQSVVVPLSFIGAGVWLVM